jgi:midasin (ATPase involved in ribosome maturation)
MSRRVTSIKREAVTQLTRGVMVMVFNATFNNISVISVVAVSFFGGKNRNTWRKTTDLPQVTDKLYHN